MKVLVLGGTRFFGVHMVNALLAIGNEVTIATRGKAKDTFGHKVQRLIVERTNPDSIAEVIGNQYFDVVCDNLAYCSNDVKALLDSVKCGRYVMTSSASVYANQHLQTAESEFNPLLHPLKWCSRLDYPYDEIKRQAESALFQNYIQFQSVAVRFPYVIGEDDYTNRLYFYVEQIIKVSPLNLDNVHDQIGFINSSEAGKFLAWTAEQRFAGTINASNVGTISVEEIINYVEKKTKKKAVYSLNGLEGTYNGQKSFCLNVMRANNLGYHFTDINEWIYELIDKYIEKANLSLI